MQLTEREREKMLISLAGMIAKERNEFREQNLFTGEKSITKN